MMRRGLGGIVGGLPAAERAEHVRGEDTVDVRPTLAE